MTSPTRWKGTRAPPVNGLADGGEMDTKERRRRRLEAHQEQGRGAQEGRNRKPLRKEGNFSHVDTRGISRKRNSPKNHMMQDHWGKKEEKLEIENLPNAAT